MYPPFPIYNPDPNNKDFTDVINNLNRAFTDVYRVLGELQVVTALATISSASKTVATTITTAVSGAPIDAQYVTLALDATLTNERRLVAGSFMEIVDGGAGGVVRVNTSFPAVSASGAPYDALYVCLSGDAVLTNERYIVAGSHISFNDLGAGDKLYVNSSSPVSASGAPFDAVYVCLSTDAILTNERVLTAGSYISLVDTGAGGLIRINSSSVSQSAAPYNATYVCLSADSALAYERVLTAGSYIELVDTGAGGLIRVNTSMPNVSASGAPYDVTYVCLSTNPVLTNERVLTAGSHISLVDTGAGGIIRINSSAPTAGASLRSATKIIAAVDSIDKTKADYVCDGVNDEVEIASAITALGTTGGEILFLEGNYYIYASVTVKSNITFKGVSGYGWGPNAVNFYLMANTTMFYGDADLSPFIQSVNFENICFSARNQTASEKPPTGTTVRSQYLMTFINRCREFNFTNCVFQYVANAVYMDTCWDFNFTRCTFNEAGVASSYPVIYLYNNYRAGQTNDACSVIRFTSCRWETCHYICIYQSSHASNATQNAVGVSLVQCKFDTPTYPAIYGGYYGMALDSNIFFNTTSAQEMITLTNKSYSVNITNNYFESNSSWAISFDCWGVTIVGNSFISADAGAGYVYARSNASNSVINSNVFLTANGASIKIAGSYIQVEGNVFNGNTTTADITLDASSSFCYVIGNNGFSGTGSWHIYTDAGTNNRKELNTGDISTSFWTDYTTYIQPNNTSNIFKISDTQISVAALIGQGSATNVFLHIKPVTVTGRSYAVAVEMESGTDGADKLSLYCSMLGKSGNAGTVWSLNPLIQMEAGFTGNGTCVEVDVNNNTGTAGKGNGISITGLGTAQKGAAIVIASNDSTSAWQSGIAFVHSGSNVEVANYLIVAQGGGTSVGGINFYDWIFSGNAALIMKNTHYINWTNGTITCALHVVIGTPSHLYFWDGGAEQLIV